MLSIFELVALLLTLSALFGWLNRRFLHLPASIGLLVLGLFASLLIAGAGALFPSSHVLDPLTNAMRQIDFGDVVLNGMLAFLLFAGAMSLDVTALRDRIRPVITLALLGTIASTLIVGFAFWWLAGWLGLPVTLPWALVFGALISPTDPVAVLAMLKGVNIPAEVEIELQGEALFNDGIGVVLFVVLVGWATGTEQHPFTAGAITEIVLHEVVGGLVLGAATGYLAYRAMRAIDDFAIETLITLALVAATYAVAQRLGTSGPLAVVAAGLLVGHRAPKDAMSDNTKRYVTMLWTLIDEILNAVLFLLIGLEVLIVTFDPGAFGLAALAIPLVIVARLIAVGAPVLAIPWSRRLSMRNVPFLTWAGVHGGISVALALSLPNTDAKPVILAATYAVVLFSLVAQGSSVGLVARLTLGDAAGAGATKMPDGH